MNEDVDHIDDGDTNSEEWGSVLRRISRGNIVDSACFVCKKDKLHYSKYSSIKHKNLIKCELFSGEIILKRVIIDNLESDDPSLVATVKRLETMIPDKDANSGDLRFSMSYHIQLTQIGGFRLSRF